MGLAPTQPATSTGAFGSLIPIMDKNYVHENLAVKEGCTRDDYWVATYEAVKPMQVQIGPVGPQVDQANKRYISGGGIEVVVPKGGAQLQSFSTR
jgi:hypothetical protein